LVQTVYPLSENTGLALTTAKYYTPSGRLIQRDYTGISLYDYYYTRDGSSAENPAQNHDVKLTDSGRTVYGGGGITPDVKLPAIKSNKFQDGLLQKYAFFNFSKHYIAIHKSIAKNFTVDEGVLQEFRHYLDDQKVPFTEDDLAGNLDWVKSNIKTELFISQFGQEEGLRVQAESDPNVIKALDLLPQARQLAENARKVVAEHSTPRLGTR
jgi:carboxyl-terminal processing protease